MIFRRRQAALRRFIFESAWRPRACTQRLGLKGCFCPRAQAGPRLLAAGLRFLTTIFFFFNMVRFLATPVFFPILRASLPATSTARHSIPAGDGAEGTPALAELRKFFWFKCAVCGR